MLTRSPPGVQALQDAPATWLSKCLNDTRGRPLPVVENAHVALEHDPALQDVLAYDEMHCAPVLLHEVGDPLNLCPPTRFIRDEDVTDIQRWLQRAGLSSIGPGPVWDAVRSR